MPVTLEILSLKYSLEMFIKVQSPKMSMKVLNAVMRDKLKKLKFYESLSRKWS